MSKASKEKLKKKLSPGDFTDHPDVIACIDNLSKEFEAGKHAFIVSDVTDEEGHQYVHLVQKGGGVLGIALIGYIYILEKMGIRFLRLAGTSAGAINTALMTAIGDKKDEKSTHILEVLSNLDFFCLVDGRPVVRRIIKKFISHHNFTTRLKWFITAIVIIGIILFLVNFTSINFSIGYIFIPILPVSSIRFNKILILFSWIYSSVANLAPCHQP